MSADTTIVRDLRRLWKPHKERLGLQQADHPTAVRFHRACSWLDQAQQMDGDQQADLVLIQQWTALNALYGRWNEEQREPVSDRQALKAFLESILRLDSSHHVITVLQDHCGLVLTIVENSYLNGYFWEEPTEESRVRLSKSKFTGPKLVRGETLAAADGTTPGTDLPAALPDGAWGRNVWQQTESEGPGSLCTLMMGHLLPAILRVWIDHGVDVNWGPLCYPPQEQKIGPVPARRPK